MVRLNSSMHLSASNKVRHCCSNGNTGKYHMSYNMSLLFDKAPLFDGALLCRKIYLAENICYVGKYIWRR